MRKPKLRVRLPDLVRAAEAQHAKLAQRLSRLETDTYATRARHDLLSACLDLLRWLHQQQQDCEEQPGARTHAVPVDELLQLEQLLELAPQPSPQADAGPLSTAAVASTSAATASAAAASPAAAAAAAEAPAASKSPAAEDAWRTCPMAPRHDPLVLMRELFQRPPPGVGPDITLQQLQDGYAAFCGELALHMRVVDNPFTEAAGAASSAARVRTALLDWYAVVMHVVHSPNAAVLAQLLATNCATGETVAAAVHDELQQSALQRLALSEEQQERISLSYHVLSQLHSANLSEAMAAAEGSLDEPAAKLFGSALPLGLLRPGADEAHPHDAALAGSSVVRERHQSDLQRLRVTLKKAYFWDHCLSGCFVGALTINQLCELALHIFPFPMRLNLLARRVAAMHREKQEQQEQQAAAARQQQEAQARKKGRRRQALRQQPGSNGDSIAKSSTDIAECGPAAG